MENISDIENELYLIEDRVENHIEHLGSTRNEITRTMNKIHEKFSNDQNGQNTVMSMYQALNALSSADGILYELKSDIKDCIGNLKK